METERYLQGLFYLLMFWIREVPAAHSQLFWPVSLAFEEILGVRFSPRTSATLVRNDVCPSKYLGLSNYT